MRVMRIAVLTACLLSAAAIADTADHLSVALDIGQLRGTQSYIMQGDGMAPTIRHHESFTVDFTFYTHHKVKRGDIVAIQLEGGTKMRISRIVALPKEKFEARDNSIFITGREAHQTQLPENQCAPIRSYFQGFSGERANRIICYEENIEGFKHIILRDSITGPSLSYSTQILKNHYYYLSDNRFGDLYVDSTSLISRGDILGKVVEIGK